MAFPLSANQIAAIQARDPNFQAPRAGAIDPNDPFAAALGWTNGTAQADPSLVARLAGGSTSGTTGGAVGGTTAGSPLTGLAGSEQSLNQFLMQALGSLTQANQQSGQQMQQGYNQALMQLQQGQQGSEQVRREQTAAAQQQIANPVTVGTGGAESILNPMINPGNAAQRRQAALSGSLGPEEQQRAMQEFNASPGQSYLREQGERAVLRNASATGNLGSGAVLMELQRQGMGLAQQDFDNSFNRLGSVADRGANAAGLLSGITSSAARDTANINNNRDMARAELASGLGNALGGERFGAGQLGAEGAFTLGQSLGNNTMRTGQLGADLNFGTGQALSAGRTRAGENIANQFSGVSQQIAQLQNEFGNNASGLVGANTGNLANLLAGQGMNEQQVMTAIAQLLAQMGGNAAGTFAGLPGMPGVTEINGIANNVVGAITGAGTAKNTWS